VGARFTAAHAVVTAIVAWGVLAFGAVYPWSYWPLLAGCAVAGGVVGLDRRARSRIPRSIVAGLAVLAAAVLLQLTPLPVGLLARISPITTFLLARSDIGFVAQSHGLMDGAGQAWWLRLHTLSIDPARTRIGLAFIIAFGVLVLAVAATVDRWLEALVRTLVGLGVTIAIIALMQKAAGSDQIYGFWTPQSAGVHPFGPFVNRNHFAGWMLMAIPLGFGYFIGLVDRAAATVKQSWHARLVWLSTPAGSGLVAVGFALSVMTMSVLFSLSRSGIVSLAVALLALAWWAVRRVGGRPIVGAYVGALAIVCIGWAGTDRLAARFDEFSLVGLGDRAAVWHDGWAVARSFPIAGTGLNTFGQAMLFFQTSDRTQHFAEAHDDYLQLAAEGGLLVCGAALLLLVLVVRETRQRFQEGADDPAAYWIRVGAVTGLVAIAAQEIGDFSLQMPGNAALCCVLVGIAIQRPRNNGGARAATATVGGCVPTCPKCSSPRVHRSRAKTRAEDVWKYFRFKRLHRCHACGWRGWGKTTMFTPDPHSEKPSVSLASASSFSCQPALPPAGNSARSALERSRLKNTL
jgi:O-antigen ligase